MPDVPPNAHHRSRFVLERLLPNARLPVSACCVTELLKTSMYGELQGIAGRSLKEIDELDMRMLEAEAIRDTEHPQVQTGVL